MKNVVFSDTAREVEFKPDPIFEQYLSLTESDVKKEFRNKKKLHGTSCPACKSDKNSKAFTKFGFSYRECGNCGTLFLSPRPSDPDIKQHFLHSPSSNFWKETLTKETEDKRREKIHLPRFQWILDSSEEYLTGDKIIADINSKNRNFARELVQKKAFFKKIFVNPYFDTRDLDKTFENSGVFHLVSAKEAMGKTKIRANIVTAFEALDYTSDPDALMGIIRNIISDDGLCFFTTISVSGFDLQILWDHSESIFPLDRINAFSYEGLKIFFDRHGFEMLEFSTPGMLDFNIVEEACRKHPDLIIPRFVRTMLERGDEQLKNDFQTFLQVNKLSSFVRIVVRKKKE